MSAVALRWSETFEGLRDRRDERINQLAALGGFSYVDSLVYLRFRR